jgi:hypothetical protein
MVCSHIFLDGETGKTVPFFGNRDNGGDLVENFFFNARPAGRTAILYP